MACSLEARAPFLDPYVVNYAQNASDLEHIDKRDQKVALKSLLKKYLPDEVISRPKSGFSVPYKYILDTFLKSRFALLIEQISAIDSNFKIDNSNILKSVDDYYLGVFFDYKLVWNIYFYLVWVRNVKSVVNNNQGVE